MQARFAGRVALVTGAATGIGAATARRLRAEGAQVYAAMLPAQLDTVADLHAAGIIPLALDVTDEAAWTHTVAQVVGAAGRLDVLVNNAGIRESNRAEDTTLDQWRRVLDTNLMGTFLGCRAVIPTMRAQGSGAIVNLSSITGIRGVRNMVAYSASKGGIVAMTASLALDCAADNIRVNCVCPGAVETGMIAGLLASADDPAAARSRMAGTHALNRIAAPDEIAAAIAFLASDDASFMTGIAVPVDGGRSVQ